MNSPPMTSRQLGRADFMHLAARPVRLTVDSGTVWVTQDGEPEDIQIDAGFGREFDGHTRLMVGTLGGTARVRVTPLAAPGLAGWAARWRALLPRRPAAGAGA